MKEKLRMDLDALAELARLRLEDNEKLVMEEEMDSFIDLLAQVGEANIASAALSFNERENVFRSDEAEKGNFAAEEMLFNAKTKEDGYITVPRVVGEENG